MTTGILTPQHCSTHTSLQHGKCTAKLVNHLRAKVTRSRPTSLNCCLLLNLSLVVLYSWLVLWCPSQKLKNYLASFSACLQPKDWLGWPSLTWPEIPQIKSYYSEHWGALGDVAGTDGSSDARWSHQGAVLRVFRGTAIALNSDPWLFSSWRCLPVLTDYSGFFWSSLQMRAKVMWLPRSREEGFPVHGEF